MRDREISRLLISFAMTLSAVAANATPTTYFGEDLSPGGILPPGGDDSDSVDVPEPGTLGLLLLSLTGVLVARRKGPVR